jgi:hypothetical protein
LNPRFEIALGKRFYSLRTPPRRVWATEKCGKKDDVDLPPDGIVARRHGKRRWSERSDIRGPISFAPFG